MNPARKDTDAVVDDRWMSQPKAAAEIGCSRQGVLAYIARGELESDVVAERIVISRESVARLVAKRAQDAQASAGVAV